MEDVEAGDGECSRDGDEDAEFVVLQGPEVVGWVEAGDVVDAEAVCARCDGAFVVGGLAGDPAGGGDLAFETVDRVTGAVDGTRRQDPSGRAIPGRRLVWTSRPGRPGAGG